MTDAKRYDAPFEVEFGGKTITVRPLKGLVAVNAFQSAVTEEIQGFALRAMAHAKAQALSPEALLAGGIDQARLLKLGLPDVMSDELIEESTAKERAGLITDLCYANNFPRAVPFLLPEVLFDLMTKLNRTAATLPAFPSPESSSSSSTSESPGMRSSAN